MDIIQNIPRGLTICVTIVMALDILTGTIKALLEKDFSSTVFRNGLFKKMLELVVIVCGGIMDYVLSTDYIMYACYYLVIGMELYSILLENMKDYISLPDWLTGLIDTIKNKGEVNAKG